MSIKVMTSVWERSQASGTDLLVLLALADNANDAGECWPSIHYIARKCRIDDRTTQRRIRSLEAINEVVVIRGGGRAGSSEWGTRSNKYIIVVHLTDDEGGDLPGVAICQGGTDDTGGVAPAPGSRVAPVPPEPSIEPSIEPPLNPQPKAGDQKPLRRGMRGTGTSPRELRAVEQQAVRDRQAEAELDRLVTAIGDKYAGMHLPEAYVLNVIDDAFPFDDERRQAALAHYRGLQEAS